MSSPVSKSVETFRLGRRTKAIKATHSAIPIASINNQWPVNTQMHTTVMDIVKLSSSAAVNRPQQPSDIRFPSVHGRMMYWHIGRRRKASATVAMTGSRSDNETFLTATENWTYSQCTRQTTFASNRRKRTSQEARWKRPTVDTTRVSYQASQNRNLCRENLWKKNINWIWNSSYFGHVSLVRPSKDCSSFHFVAFSLFHELLAPCWDSGSCRRRWAEWKSGMLRRAIQTAQPPSLSD